MNSTQTTMPAPVDRDVHGLRALHKAGRHDEAVTLGQALSQDGDRDVLLLTAASLRHLGRLPEALALLERLEVSQPRFSRMHQERGLCYIAQKDAPRAIDALLRAVNINPALPVSWRMLEGVYRITGDAKSAATAAAHVATLNGLPAPIVSATSLYCDGDLESSERIIRAFLLEHGNHPEGMRLLAKIGMARGVLDDAELLLESVLVLAPGHHAARHDYAQVLLQRHKYRQAREQAGQLLTLDPASRDYLTVAATAAVGLGDQDKAIAIYRRMLADMPENPDVHLWLGHALKTVGTVPDAIAAYQGAIAARPDFGDAYWSLANLKTYRFTDAEIAAMRGAEQALATTDEDRVHLCFALGKALEDRGEVEQSWDHYARGNALKRVQSRYRPEILETNTARQIAVCTGDFFKARTGWGDPAPDPIFVLGLPRSGSTLIEQILASHSQIEGTQELPDIQRIVLELQGRDPDLNDPRYPASLTDLREDEIRQLGRRYIEETRVHRTGRPFFIDKMPNNFRHIGLIHLILPNAKIIDARREPMSCCFSNFKQLFANGQEFTYGIEDIAGYYRTYLELMEHWDRVLPGRVLRVQHEDVIGGLEGSVRRILDHCGLPFEQDCVDFHRNRRAVRTPSSEQVRQPIFREGLDQWKAFAPWLDPLRESLGDAVTRYRA
jgi:tetratricopeptide (TPR) repeat protein